MTEDKVFQSNFTQGNRARLVNLPKRIFTILAADKETVGTFVREDGAFLRAKYSAKSHVKALEQWAGRPIIVNHGNPDVRVIGEVLSADISEEGLILTFRIDDDRALDIIQSDMYEGWSIGTASDPNNPEYVNDGTILQYVPVENSMIMYPATPACPKGVCDILSMMVHSCEHTEGKVPSGDGKMSDEKTESKKCGCNGQPVLAQSAMPDMSKFISKAEHDVAKVTYEDRINELEAELNEVKQALSARETALAKYEDDKKAMLISSLPKTDKIDYNALEISDLERLVSFHQELKETMKPSALEVNGDAAPEGDSKPWKFKYEVGKY